MSIALVRLGMMVFFVTPAAVELDIWRADHGWDQPILMKVWGRGAIFLATMKRAASYNLAEENMTNRMIWERISSGLF